MYVNTLNSGFVFDDHRGIDLEKTSIWELFQNDSWGGCMSRVESHKSYRPLTVLTYRYLNYYFTELRPFSYHLVNVLMRCVASILFLFVCKVILGEGNQSGQCLHPCLQFTAFILKWYIFCCVMGPTPM